jgi:hypothetical protein
MAKETITIDQLAKMTNEGFRTTATKDEVAASHSEMNRKFEAVASRLEEYSLNPNGCATIPWRSGRVPEPPS